MTAKPEKDKNKTKTPVFTLSVQGYCTEHGSSFLFVLRVCVCVKSFYRDLDTKLSLELN